MLNRNFLLILALIFLSTFVLANSCTPYEEYSVASVIPAGSGAFIVIKHSEFICKKIADEWVLRRNSPEGDYYFFYFLDENGKATFLGKSYMLLEDPPIVAETNGSFYVLQRRERLIPYKNITLTVGGSPRNFTIMAKKIELKAYRLKGECFRPVWNCAVLKFENGSATSNCPKNWPSSIKTEMPGVQTTSTYSNYNPKKFRSVLLTPKSLVYYTEPIKTKLGSGIHPCCSIRERQ
ncbi:hypothetical protein [Pyrococcus kukulkanii]|uniref:Uncharacterized protein n=1 Tax=Pyrococcus kukulkanii TaxID=1609559 RepID=A0ABV4T3S5_9EURY